MNIYELLEVFQRQKRLLIAGSLLLVVLVVGVFVATPPKFTATLRMIVVQDGVDTLTDAGLASSDYFRIASIYGDLLSSPEAGEEITDGAGVVISGFRVRTLNEVSGLEVDVDAETAESAEAGALESFAWLERRIRRSSEVLFTPVEEPVVPPVLDEDRLLDVDLDIFVEPLYEEVDPSLWLEIDTLGSNDFSTPVQLLQSGMTFRTNIEPSSRITINIGPEIGDVMDEVQVRVPDLPTEPNAGISLDLHIRRGAVLFGAEDGDARLNSSAFSLTWNNPVTESAGQGKIAVLLMNPDLTAVPVGQRRAPIFATAVMMLGIAVLVIQATARDGWQRRKQGGVEDTPPSGVLSVERGRSAQARS